VRSRAGFQQAESSLAGGFVCWHSSSANTRNHLQTLKFLTVEVEIDSEGEDRRAVITYTYSVAGTTYQGRRVFFGDRLALAFPAPQQRRLAAYVGGQGIGVAYDPAAPHESVLESGPHVAAYLEVVVPALLALVGLLML